MLGGLCKWNSSLISGPELTEQLRCVCTQASVCTLKGGLHADVLICLAASQNPCASYFIRQVRLIHEGHLDKTGKVIQRCLSVAPSHIYFWTAAASNTCCPSRLWMKSTHTTDRRTSHALTHESTAAKSNASLSQMVVQSSGLNSFSSIICANRVNQSVRGAGTSVIEGLRSSDKEL